MTFGDEYRPVLSAICQDAGGYKGVDHTEENGWQEPFLMLCSYSVLLSDTVHTKATIDGNPVDDCFCGEEEQLVEPVMETRETL